MSSMNETVIRHWKPPSTAQTQAKVAAGLRRRYRREQRFRAYGILAVALGLLFVVFLFGSIIAKGWTVFRQTHVTIDVFYDPQIIDPAGTRLEAVLRAADYKALLKAALRARFPQVEGRENLRELTKLLSNSAASVLQARVVADPALIGRRESVALLTNSDVDWLIKGRTLRTNSAACSSNRLAIPRRVPAMARVDEAKSFRKTIEMRLRIPFGKATRSSRCRYADTLS